MPDLIDLRSPFWIGLEEPFDEVLELLAALERVGVEAVVEVGELDGHFETKWNAAEGQVFNTGFGRNNWVCWVTRKIR